MNLYIKAKTLLSASPTQTKKSEWVFRLSVLSRVAAAALGGYALALVASIVLAHFLPSSRSDGVLWGTQLSFVIYACAVIWVFSTRTAFRAWVGILLPTLVLGFLAGWLTREVSL
ncbi:DUF3649 domain-containing protein [Nitrincola sp. MINF-07-Sa-05]|uniref:DUF3649 domain-containing protein n=1 Tax=Nitrincola salilacus TaxID=3400273 RepID=UPI00391812D0